MAPEQARLLIIELIIAFMAGVIIFILFYTVYKRLKRKHWKKNLYFIFGWVLVVMTISILLSVIEPDSRMALIIHIISLVTLIFVTLYTALQTQKVVSQGKLFFGKEKKKTSLSVQERL